MEGTVKTGTGTVVSAREPMGADQQKRSTGPARTDQKQSKVTGPGMDTSKDTHSGGGSRYLVRILKGSALPLLYVLVSFFMLRKYVLEYEDYYEYKTIMILLGSVLGLISMSGLTVYNIYRASRKKRNGIRINNTMVIAIYVPLILLIVLIALVFGISTVWQFSFGFFLTALIPPVLVVSAELLMKARFFVHDQGERSSRLVFVPNGE